MKYNYNGLWKILIDKGMTRTEMRKQAGISTNVLAKLGKNEPISLQTLAKICVTLDCSVDDVLSITTDDK